MEYDLLIGWSCDNSFSGTTNWISELPRPFVPVPHFMSSESLLGTRSVQFRPFSKAMKPRQVAESADFDEGRLIQENAIFICLRIQASVTSTP
jgi:hypothetical protein